MKLSQAKVSSMRAARTRSRVSAPSMPIIVRIPADGTPFIDPRGCSRVEFVGAIGEEIGIARGDLELAPGPGILGVVARIDRAGEALGLPPRVVGVELGGPAAAPDAHVRDLDLDGTDRVIAEDDVAERAIVPGDMRDEARGLFPQETTLSLGIREREDLPVSVTDARARMSIGEVRSTAARGIAADAAIVGLAVPGDARRLVGRVADDGDLGARRPPGLDVLDQRVGAVGVLAAARSDIGRIDVVGGEGARVRVFAGHGAMLFCCEAT